MRKTQLILLLLITLLVSAPLANAQTKSAATKAKTAANSGRVNYQAFKLKNGLRVFLIEDHSAPVISLALNYDVGSRNEKKGRTGFAHLFEHMMFQGSENIGKSEHFILVDSNGGQMNGTTNEERTLYFESLPSNQLDLLLFLEADRMRGLDITKENLANQINAVQEERRLGVDNQPYGAFRERLGEEMYDNFAYKHSVIGSMADLSAASVEDVREFFKIYYAPNNAVLVLVGDFKPAVALAKIKAAFESIPAQPMPAAVDTTEPEQTSERRFTLEDGLAQLPLLAIGYKGIRGNTDDAYALQVLSTILGGGQSSRLYQKLVKEKQMALGVGSFAQTRRGPGALMIQANLPPGKKVEEAEVMIYEEIARLKSEPVEDWELTKAKQFAKRSAINGRASSLGLAIRFVENITAWNDPQLINTQFDKINAITKADIQRVARQYLSAQTRTVGIVLPKPRPMR